MELGKPRSLDVHLAVSAKGRSSRDGQRSHLNTQNAGLGQSVDYGQVSKLPYFDRSAGALLALTPGVRYTGEDRSPTEPLATT